jgi:hypothetical protein
VKVNGEYNLTTSYGINVTQTTDLDGSSTYLYIEINYNLSNYKNEKVLIELGYKINENVKFTFPFITARYMSPPYLIEPIPTTS